MNATHFRLRLRLRAPFLFKSGASLPLGLDVATLEDQDGHALIPGTHLRGHLSHALREFSQFGGPSRAWINTWFGSESGPGASDTPARGRLDFSAYWRAVTDDTSQLPRNQWMAMPSASFTGQGVTRYRVRIDDDTGTADPGALQLIGQTHAAGSIVSFEGRIGADGATDNELKDVEHWLSKALAWIPALGALKGIGFGGVESYELICETIEHKCLELPASTADSLALSFHLDRPYCFGARALETNRFESVPYVPGGALRGALFEYCKRVCPGSDHAADADLILEHAASISIRHAWASAEQRTPAVVPESAVYVDDALVDASVAPWDRPFILKRGQHTKVPAFPIDWKGEWGRFARDHGHISPGTWTEVRTAIDANRLSAAEEKLFSYDARQPNDGDGPYTFRTIVSFASAAPATELWKALSRLLPCALSRLGKTEARAFDIALTEASEHSDIPETGRIVLCLQSDALICQTTARPTDDDDALLLAYRAYFAQHAQGALRLVDLFVDQKLAGGDYFRNRFWSQDPTYRARVITKAGSVFVFECSERESATPILRDWLRYGLPPAEAEDWQRNPFLRANGYGEVRLGTGLNTQEPTGEVAYIKDACASKENAP